MQEKAKVISIQDDIVSVMPLDIEACIGCSNSECKKNGNVFTVVNRRNLDIVIGSEVRVIAPMKNQLSQAGLAVGIPIVLGTCAFILVALVAPAAGEGLRVGAALATLVVSMVFMYRMRHMGPKDLPEIVEVF